MLARELLCNDPAWPQSIRVHAAAALFETSVESAAANDYSTKHRRVRCIATTCLVS